MNKGALRVVPDQSHHHTDHKGFPFDDDAFGIIDHVSKTYFVKKGQPPVTAIEKATCQINKGEFVSLLGPSGCGKTTLLRIVGGLTQPSTGRVLIDGKKIDGPQSNFGFVFQSLNLLPWRTVLKNVLLPVEIIGNNDSTAKERARELLDLVGLAGFEKSRPSGLSGGMQQRVALCRALIHKPSLLLMDEPFGALDELTRMEMHDLLLKVRANTGTTILFVTHSISEAIYLSDQVLVFTKRPSRINKRMRIKLPYPREIDLRYTKEFNEYEREATEALGVFKK